MLVSLFVFTATFVLSMIGLIAMITAVEYWFDYCLENRKGASFAVSVPIAYIFAVFAVFAAFDLVF